jgi:chromosome segregation ATPase
LKALVATLQSQLHKSRDRIRALEDKEPMSLAPHSGEMESMTESLAAAQMQHISALSETRRLQGEVGQLRAGHALLHARLQERERDVQSLLAEIQEGTTSDGGANSAAAAAAAAWEDKAHRLSARLKRCKVCIRLYI